MDGVPTSTVSFRSDLITDPFDTLTLVVVLGSSHLGGHMLKSDPSDVRNLRLSTIDESPDLGRFGVPVDGFRNPQLEDGVTRVLSSVPQLFLSSFI